jgi:hypothetical protein
MRRDYLRLLTHFANERLPPASDHMHVVKRFDHAERCAPTPDTQHTLVPRSSSIWSFDASHRNSPAINFNCMPAGALLSQEGDIWQERSQQIALLAQRDPQIVLVNIYFQHSPSHTASPFAAMRYSPDAPDGQKYSVMTSLLRLGQRGVDLKAERSRREHELLMRASVRCHDFSFSSDVPSINHDCIEQE